MALVQAPSIWPAVYTPARSRAWPNSSRDGETRVAQLKRTFDELVEHLFRSQAFPTGAVLLTGAGIVPDDSFTLHAGDSVRITISGIGTLENPVVVV